MTKKKKILETKIATPLHRSLKWWWIAVFVALCAAMLMRLPFFGSNPGGLNRDEAALGYNAYSILKTGHDEYGKMWPISIASFGDQKLPGYVYTLVPFVAVLDLHPYVVRLPSLLAGFIIVFAMGILTLQIGESLKLTQKQKICFSFFTMLFIAVAPWANHFSRVAYEAHEALALFIVGLVAYNAADSTENIFRQRFYFILAAICWSATLLTYHSYHIFLPLFLLGIVAVDFHRLRKADTYGIRGGIVVGLLILGLLFYGGVLQADAVKNSGISPFSKAHLAELSTQFRGVTPGDNAIYERFLFNPFTEAIVTLSENILATFSGNFYFVHGSGHGDHNPGNMSNMHLFIAPLLFFGVIYLWSLRRNILMKRVIVWLCFSVIPAALTITPQHEIRLSPIFPLLEFLAAFGAVMLLTKIEKKWFKKVVTGVLILCVVSSAFRTFIRYNYLIPGRIQSNERYHILSRALGKYQKEGLPVYTQSPTSSPYIWYLFENKYDPQKLLSDIERYPVDEYKFIHVKRIGNVHFETVKWDDLFYYARSQPLILIFKPTEVPIELQKDPRLSLLETLKDLKGDVIYSIWKIQLLP